MELSGQISATARMILIGSGALLWHAFQRGISEPLPESSMDVDPITDSEELARLCYEAMIGSQFEQDHGWHVNLMPDLVLREFPLGWESRAARKQYRLLEIVVPAPGDLMVPKLRRNEPRDRAHEAWAKQVGLIA